MRTKLIKVGLLAVIISSCATPRYLPVAEEIDVNQYGSYIKISRIRGENVNGELLAIDTNKLFVLTESETDYSKKFVIVPINEVERFTLQYAQPKQYGWTIPVGILLPLFPFPDPAERGSMEGGGMPFHGFYAFFSIPINLIVTISVTKAGEKSFEYSNYEISYEKLKMFARFPQGIPSNINLANIK